MSETDARLNYIELPVRDLAASRAFFAAMFGWSFLSYGPEYSATEDMGTNIGLDASAEAVAMPLAVVEVQDLDAALAAVGQAGGIVVKPVFAFPGGRRFHVQEPSGNILAIWSAA